MHDASKDRGRGVLAWILIVLGVLWVGAAAPEAVADGKAFTRQVAVPAEMPDQEALIVHRDGVETLVIETNVRTKADELAWVVPLPSVPEIAETTTGVFPTLRALTAPRLVRSESYPGIFAALFLLTLLALMVMKSGWGRVLFYILFVLLVGVMMMPSLGKARSAGGSMTTRGVDVVSRDIVGSFMTEVIRSEDPAVLVAWLREHGYECPDESKPAIAAYVAKKWVFAAMQLRKADDGKGELLTPHPLVFHFPTATPVYPMALTLPQREDFSLSLYVFGTSRCSAEGMTTELADRVQYEPLERGEWWGYRDYWHAQPFDFIVSHDTLDSIVRPATFVTKLTRSWKAGEAAHDIVIQDAPGPIVRKRVWSKEAVGAIGAQTGFIVAFVGACIAVAGRASGWTLARSAKVVLAASLIGVVAGVIHGRSLPTTGVVRIGDASPDAGNIAYEVSKRAAAKLAASQHDVDIEWVRGQFLRVVSETQEDMQRPIEINEGDRPGDYRFVVDDRDGTRTLFVYGFSVTGHQYILEWIPLSSAPDTAGESITPATVPDPPSGR